VTYAGLAKSSTIQNEIPDFAEAFTTVANVRVRHAATLGGNIMSRNAGYDLLPSLLVLGGRLVFTNQHGNEEHCDGAASRFPEGLLTRIEIPAGTKRRFLLDRSYKPIVSLAVCVEWEGGRISGRASLGCAHGWPVVLPLELGSAPALKSLAERAARAASTFAAQLTEPVTDINGSAAYRRTLAEVLLRRALTRLAKG
jgi:carbon-monoxide dehydrogenase medium subunit